MKILQVHLTYGYTGSQTRKISSDPDFVNSYEADKKYAQENGMRFVEMKDREIVALIAYLQRLGTDIKIKKLRRNRK